MNGEKQITWEWRAGYDYATEKYKAEIDRLRAEVELWKDRANRARALLAEHHPAMEDAASQINRLRAENAKLREDIAAHLNTILYLQMESIRAKTAKEGK